MWHGQSCYYPISVIIQSSMVDFIIIIHFSCSFSLFQFINYEREWKMLLLSQSLSALFSLDWNRKLKQIMQLNSRYKHCNKTGNESITETQWSWFFFNGNLDWKRMKQEYKQTKHKNRNVILRITFSSPRSSSKSIFCWNILNPFILLEKTQRERGNRNCF